MERSTDLLSALVTSTFADVRDSSDALIQHWQLRAMRAEAELELVRTRVLSLYRGDYMPTPTAIERALYAGSAAIEARLLPDSA